MSRILSRRAQRFFSTSLPRPAFATGPTPPRLPQKDQEEFERLQKTSTGAFSTPRASPSLSQINQARASKSEGADGEGKLEAKIAASGKGEELHPDVRRGAKPEFEGDVNPKTGEVGGPKNEPLRWGSTERSGDWSYNGRVTDF